MKIRIAQEEDRFRWLIIDGTRKVAKSVKSYRTDGVAWSAALRFSRRLIRQDLKVVRDVISQYKKRRTK